MRLFSRGKLESLSDRAFSAEKSLEAETTRANVAAHRIQELESDLITLQGQHANTLKGNETIAGERDAAVRELKVRADLILQHGRQIADLTAQLVVARRLATVRGEDLERVRAESLRLQEIAALRAAEIVKERDAARAQNERLLRDNTSAITTTEAAIANATASQAKCEELLARGEILTKERDAAILRADEASKLSLASSQAEVWQAGEIKRLTAERSAAQQALTNATEDAKQEHFRLVAERDAAQKAYADAEKRIGELEDRCKISEAGLVKWRTAHGNLINDHQRLLDKHNS